MTEKLIIDKDHILQIVKKSGYIHNIHNTQTKLIEALFASQNIHEYILGPAGCGKSTKAMNDFGGIYIDNIDDMLDHVQKGKPTIIVQSNTPNHEVASKANNIYIFDMPASRIYKQRQYRGENNTFTNFGRNQNATTGAPTDNITNKYLLNKDFGDKTYIYKFGEEAFDDHYEKIQLSKISNLLDIITLAIGETAGKFAPPHLGHTGMVKEILKLYDMVNIIVGGSLNKGGLTNHEIEGMFSMVMDKMKIFFGNLINYNNENYIKIGSKIVKVDMQNSAGILGKERLPEGFISGNFEDPMLQEFISEAKKNKNSQLIAPLKNMSKFGTIMRAPDVKILGSDGREIYISSSDYRSRLLGNNSFTKKEIRSWFEPEIGELLTQKDNIYNIKQRLLNSQKLEKQIQKTLLQIELNYQKKYRSKRGDGDFYTKDNRPKEFDGSTPRGEHKEEKKALIEKMKEEKDKKEKELKEEHKAKDIGKLKGINY